MKLYNHLFTDGEGFVFCIQTDANVDEMNEIINEVRSLDDYNNEDVIPTLEKNGFNAYNIDFDHIFSW